MQSQKIWKGLNIHAYTADIQTQISAHIQILTRLYGLSVKKDQFEIIMREMTQTYGTKVTFSNFRNNYKNDWILDPDLPEFNIAVLLLAVWNILKCENDNSMYKHFGETLDDIGTTCVQGISHRLFIDYIAFQK